MTNKFKDIFPVISELSCTDKFNSFEIKYQTNLDNLDRNNDINELFKNITDDWILNILIENFVDPIQLKSILNTEEFLKKLNKEKATIEDEKINLVFSLNKKINNREIYIYDEDSFFKQIENQNFTQFLNNLASLIDAKSIIYFKTFDKEEKTSFSTNHIFFNLKNENNQLNIKPISDSCYYSNKTDYPFSPAHFKLIDGIEKDNSFIRKLNVCNMVFNIISIADYSEIRDNNLYYKIIGYRTFEGKIECDKISLGSLETYNKIFDWVYSEEGNLNDKLGLTRNILSIYLKKGSLDIEHDAFYSIQSGYKTYIQSNLNKYIDIRSKITDQLELINKKANSSIENVLSNYQKSSYAFISFFISIFVLRVLAKGDFENVFTKDASIILIIFIGISILYLIYSLWLFNSEKKRLKDKYQNLKNRFEDLLIKDDINKILRNDKEFNDEISFIVKKRKAYTILWVGTILLFVILLLSLSSYINWNLIYNSIFTN